MNKFEKTKVAIEVALYYFTINTLFYLFTMILPQLIFKPKKFVLAENLRLPAIYFVSFIVIIIFLFIYFNLLKRKVQVAFSVDNKPLIFITVGVLLIVTGVTKIPMYVSSITNVKDISLGRIYDIYRAVVTILIYVVQIGIGASLTFMAIKWDKQIEKIKLAVDIALYYFTITTVLNFLRIIVPDLLFTSNMKLISALISNLRFHTLHYIVDIVIILSLAILSNFLKRKIQQRISIDNKLLLYLIVGVVLIITGVIEIPPQVSWVFTLLDSIDNYQTTQILNYVYYNIAQIVFFALQIGIGAYFTFMTIRRDKQLAEKHLIIN